MLSCAQATTRSASIQVMGKAECAATRQCSDRKNRTLIELAANDPHRGIALLFDRFGVQVNALVRRLLGSHPDHDDVVQSAFCAMMDSLQQVREPEKLDAWVRAVTVNAVLQELRKQRFRRGLLSRLPRGRTRLDFVQDVETRALLRRAQQLLDAMPAIERMIFLLHHAEALTSQQVADTCGYSLATVKRKLARARARFYRLAALDPDLKRLVEQRGPP